MSLMSLPEVQVEGERAQYLCKDCRAPHPVHYTISARFKAEHEVEEALAILVHYRQFHPTPELDARIQALKWVVGRVDRV